MRTVWILGDQLFAEPPALAEPGGPAESSRLRAETVVLMVESKGRGSLERYHQQKLVLIYSAMRHYARDLRAAGWTVDYRLIEEDRTFEDALRQNLERHHSEKLVLSEPHSFVEAAAIEKLARRLRVPLELHPSPAFLMTREDFHAWAGRQRGRLLMENHYRRLRKRTGWLMEPGGTPTGGAWNYDHDNRETWRAWRNSPVSLTSHRPAEAPDEITREVIAMVEREFPQHPGRAADFWLPTDRAGALGWLADFVQTRLPHFGAFEDTMATGDPVLCHSVLSPLLNTGLLTPTECIEAALAAYEKGAAPLNSVEGYVRQILGWREFINGVYWHRGPAYKELNELGAERPLPAWFYTAETPMNCLHHTLRQTLAMGWNHHIQRLMILGNFFLIAGVRPREALRWYLEMYVDAFDWVMAANVLGMSLYADGGYMATKPYAATSSYIRKMSDYCAGCSFDPDEKTGPKACPYNYLYWDFLDRHTERFEDNPRMKQIIAGWRKRPEEQREAVRESARTFLAGHVPTAPTDRGTGLSTD